MKNNEFDEFLNILDEKINKRNIPKTDFKDLSDIILNEKQYPFKNSENISVDNIKHVEEITKCINEKCNNYYEGYSDYCDTCNLNTKTCENCGDEFITDKDFITECGDC